MSPPVRSRGATGPIPGALTALAGLLLAVLAATGTAGSAAAASPDTPSGSPADAPAETGTPTPTPTPGPPTLGPLPTGLVTSLPLLVTGSAQPGETVDVSGGSTTSAATSCSATAAADGSWSCSLRRLPDGPGVPVRVESRSTGLSDAGRVDVLSPPVITSKGGGTTGGGIRGTAYPGATVTVTAENGRSCSFPADGSGAWGCVLSGLADGRHTVTATQVAPFSSTRSAASASVAIVLDTTAPVAPTIASPAPGARVDADDRIGFGGRGETGDAVTVYASTKTGTTVACTATVAAGAWACAATLPAGSYVASALERDAAGNVSAGSNPVALTVAATAPAAPRSTPGPTAVPTPTPTVPAPAAPGIPPRSTPHPGTKGFIDTPFTTAGAPVVSAAAVPGWLRSLALAVAALLLLLLPARLLAAALTRDRSADPVRASVFGRNRASAELGEADALLGGRHSAAGPAGSGTAQPVWLAPVVGLGAAALVTLSISVQDAGAYLRLLLAVAIAVAGINAVWVLAARGMARHLGFAPPRPLVRPALLLVVAAAALGSRLIGLEPALLFGLVLAAALPGTADRVARGRVAAVQVSAVAALGVLAWLTVGVLPTPSGALSAFLRELANAIALVGIGSTAIVLLPLGGLAGRAVFQWSRPIWLGLSLVVYTVLFALLLPVASLAAAGTGVVVAVVAALAFAALSVSVWLWERYVEPAR